MEQSAAYKYLRKIGLLNAPLRLLTITQRKKLIDHLIIDRYTCLDHHFYIAAKQTSFQI
jgi:hypothetical protein